MKKRPALTDDPKKITAVFPDFKPLCYEAADRILRYVLSVCGYREVHLKPFK